MRISDWSSDVCSSDLTIIPHSLGTIARNLSALDRKLQVGKKLNSYRAALRASENLSLRKDGYFLLVLLPAQPELQIFYFAKRNADDAYREYERFERMIPLRAADAQLRSEEHTSELQSLMRISYAVFCLKKKKSITTEVKP